MRLLRIGLLAVILSAVLTAALLTGYHQDQHAIRWFPGTGIAGKIDVLGAAPTYLSIDNAATGRRYTVQVVPDGTFVAPLPPGTYDLRLINDDRSVTLAVPNGECLDLVLDFRFPLWVLKVRREGLPVPEVA